MSSDQASRRVQVEQDGRVVAEAEIERLDPPGAVKAAVHVESGHLPTGVRSRLVADVFDCPEVKDAEHFTGVVPRGDAELLDCMRERLTDPATRPAGASVIVEADTPHA